MLKYEKGSLFEVPKFSYLVHACNTQGVWGAGIAKEFKKRFPDSFKHHKAALSMYPIGSAVICPEENGHRVVCLLVSHGIGGNKDKKASILKHTMWALEDFREQVEERNQYLPIYSNKFNSGLFGVEWDRTEAILKDVLKYSGLKWTVREV